MCYVLSVLFVSSVCCLTLLVRLWHYINMSLGIYASFTENHLIGQVSTETSHLRLLPPNVFSKWTSQIWNNIISLKVILLKRIDCDSLLLCCNIIWHIKTLHTLRPHRTPHKCSGWDAQDWKHRCPDKYVYYNNPFIGNFS